MATTLDRDAILNALRVVVDPDLRRDIVSLGFVKDVAASDGTSRRGQRRDYTRSA